MYSVRRKRLIRKHKDVPYRKETASPLRSRARNSTHDNENADEFTVKKWLNLAYTKFPLRLMK
jgi:hypothetical protein